MSRFGYVMTTYLAVMLMGILSIVSFAPKLIWNASASTPIGLYAINAPGRLGVTDLVAVRAPEPLATFLSDGGYLPRGVPLMKHVAALPGQRICRNGTAITVDGIAMGDALDHDRRGRPLPTWQGCRVVADGELFLMNWRVRDSLDGRYFGPLPISSVIGRATPLYTDEDGDGRFVWRAPTR
ncbi:S26 family signal peptidase [Labrys monachus]|uniref:Conjugative transfer signal peptidase TraF n=1 Tax=Labrys monachus TaxID=217067 RepID=A0ABU0FGJ9_9HYPH|nr:S26 family signal peptidase [Labrys monachus]MDQ0393739.1 conjugative transfer signal peptidase TraF [Labrys monachus]